MGALKQIHSSNTAALTLDEALDRRVGGFGLAHYIMVAVCSICFLPFCIVLLMVFTSADPVEAHLWECTSSLDQHCAAVHASSPVGNGFCSLETVQYRWTAPTHSIISTYDLVCGQSWKVTALNSLYFVGLALGGALFGVVADKWGRKRVLYGTCLLCTVCTTCSALSGSFWGHAAWRLLSAAAVQGMSTTNMVLVTELVGPTYRGRVGAVTQAFFMGGECLLVLFAYYMRDWRHLTLACASLSAAFMFTWPLLPESPRWLLAWGHHDQAVAVLLGIAARNGKKLMAEDFACLREGHGDSCQVPVNAANAEGAKLGTPADSAEHSYEHETVRLLNAVDGPAALEQEPQPTQPPALCGIERLFYDSTQHNHDRDHHIIGWQSDHAEQLSPADVTLHILLAAPRSLDGSCPAEGLATAEAVKGICVGSINACSQYEDVPLNQPNSAAAGGQSTQEPPCALALKQQQQQQQPEAEFKAPTLGILTAARNHTLQLYFAVLSVSLCTLVLAYYGPSFALGSTSLAGSTYINFLLLSLAEAPSALAMYLVIDRLGRVTIMLLGLVLGGLACILVGLLPGLGQVALAMVSKFCSYIAWSTLVIYANEVLPTSVRSALSGGIGIMGRLGGAAAPFLFMWAASSGHRQLPFLTMGLCSLLAALLCLLLPETGRAEQPDTLEEMQQLPANDVLQRLLVLLPAVCKRLQNHSCGAGGRDDAGTGPCGGVVGCGGVHAVAVDVEQGEKVQLLPHGNGSSRC